jgi:hypothetical protein
VKVNIVTRFASAASFAAALIVISSAACTAGSIKDSKSGCKLSDLYAQKGVSVEWSGGCKGGVASGKGTATWSVNGEVAVKYTGKFVGGVLQGKGTSNNLFHKSVYTGNFKDGVPDGKGKVVQGATSYEGDWIHGVQQGQGIFRFPSGNVYRGGVVDGYKIGHGRLTYADGTYFEGEFIKDSPEGDGTCHKGSHTGPCTYKNGAFVEWK